MEKDQFFSIMDEKIKLIRAEYGLTQEKMAPILGISKKTLVEIEKNRISLGWTGSVALASMFSDSKILNEAIGGSITDVIITIAFRDTQVTYPKTWGGEIWWKTVEEKHGNRIQQNMVSRHYRILDQRNRRLLATYNFEEAKETLEIMS
jgi:DNA-binding XRE family transcriptional regulator